MEVSAADVHHCADVCRSLPVSVDTDAGILQPGSCASISVQLAAHEVGPVAGELLVYVAGRAEPYRQSLSAAVVQQSFELLDASSIAISEVRQARSEQRCCSVPKMVHGVLLKVWAMNIMCQLGERLLMLASSSQERCHLTADQLWQLIPGRNNNPHHQSAQQWSL